MKRRTHYCCLIMAQMSLQTFSAPGAQVFFSDAGTGVIFRANPDGTGVRPIVDTGFTSWTMPIEVDPTGQRIYWVEVSNATSSSRIRSATYDGGEIQTLVDNTDTGRILDLEFDQASQQIYWSDQARNRIERINLDGTDREDLTLPSPDSIEEVVGIALDLSNNSIYYTSDFSNGIVGRFDLANKTVIEFIDGPSSCCSFGGIWDIELEPNSNLLYFIDEDDSELFSIRTDGTEFTELFEPSGGLTPRGLELHEDSMYLAFANSGNVTSNAFPPGDDEFGIVSSGHSNLSGVAIDPLAIPEPRTLGLLFLSLGLIARVRRVSRIN